MSNWGSVSGPDVSFYQDNNSTPQQINFNQMRSAGADFVIIRAGQNEWTDPDFAFNWQAAKSAGLPRGSYWFYDSRVSPITQAKKFVTLLANDKPECGAWLDLEESYNGPYYGWNNWILCLSYLRLNLPRVGIYTGPGYWAGYRQGLVKVPGRDVYQPKMTAETLSYFKSFELWIAHYNVISPAIPAPWTSAVFWQYGTPAVGIQYGCESIELDMNYFNGDMSTFRNYFDLPYIPPEVIMGQWYIVNTDKLNIRQGPGTSYLDIGDLFRGDKVEASGNPIGGWIQIAKIVRVSGATETPENGWCSTAYLLPTEAPTVPPPVTYPASVTLHYADGTNKTYIPE